MKTLKLFVFGRTKTEDYRWLLGADFGIRQSFFEKTQELNQRRLMQGDVLYLAEKDADCCLFALSFLSRSEQHVDERGRPISFSIGFTCSADEAETFSQYLPTFIKYKENLADSLSDTLLQAQETGDFSPLAQDFKYPPKQLGEVVTSESVSSNYNTAECGAVRTPQPLVVTPKPLVLSTPLAAEKLPADENLQVVYSSGSSPEKKVANTKPRSNSQNTCNNKFSNFMPILFLGGLALAGILVIAVKKNFLSGMNDYSGSAAAPVATDKKSAVVAAPVATDKKSAVVAAPVATDKKSAVVAAPVATDKKSAVVAAPVATDKKSAVVAAPVATDKKSAVAATPSSAPLAIEGSEVKKN